MTSPGYVEIKREVLEQAVSATAEMLWLTDGYHNATGHEVKGAACFGSCDAICEHREPLRAALTALRSALEGR